MNRYIGVDVHKQSCTFTVLNQRGKVLKTEVVETHGQALVEFLKLIPGTIHLCIEEGTQSQWMYEISGISVTRRKAHPFASSASGGGTPGG